MGQWGSNGGLFNQATLIYIYNDPQSTVYKVTLISFMTQIRLNM